MGEAILDDVQESSQAVGQTPIGKGSLQAPLLWKACCASHPHTQESDAPWEWQRQVGGAGSGDCMLDHGLGQAQFVLFAENELGGGPLEQPLPSQPTSQISAAPLPLVSGSTNRFLDSWLERKPLLIPPSLPSPPQFSD